MFVYVRVRACGAYGFMYTRLRCGAAPVFTASGLRVAVAESGVGDAIMAADITDINCGNGVAGQLSGQRSRPCLQSGFAECTYYGYT